jgi:hypothetical protein
LEELPSRWVQQLPLHLVGKEKGTFHDHQPRVRAGGPLCCFRA